MESSHSPHEHRPSEPSSAAPSQADRDLKPLRTVTFIDSGQREQLPGATPTVSKPWNMGPTAGAAVAVAEREGKLLLRYTAKDGTEAEILSLPLTLAEHNPGDEFLLKVPESDAEGHPVYKLVIARID